MSDKALKKYGDPKANETKFMTIWIVPENIKKAIPVLPSKMYINKDIIKPLTSVLLDLIESGLHKEIKTFDGCFNIRLKRGLTTPSIHSWGIALDLNASQNPLNKTKAQCVADGLKPFSVEFDKVWRLYGWTCGIDWKRADGMHFEYTKHL